MKTIFLVRHAKSDWGNETLSDIDRHLNARGYKDAQAMSLRMKAKNEIPEIIISSNAIRALSTAVIFLRNLCLGGEKLKVREAVYEASAEQLLKIIRKIKDKYTVVLLVCHNPGITNVVNRICNASVDTIPTSGIVCIDMDTDSWKKAGDASGTLRYFDFPKNQRE